MINKKVRIEWIDLAKGIGIVCVFLGHLGVEMIDRVVFIFHMPLFFILSGILLKVDDISFGRFITQKSKRLLIPYYATGGIICFLLFLADFFRKMWEKILPDIQSMLIAIICGSGFKVSHSIDGIGALWFLWALFWASLIVKIVVLRRWNGVHICILSVLSYISTHFFWLPLSIQPGICASFFVYLGVRLQRINWKEALNKKRALGALAIFLIGVILDIRLDMAQNVYDYGIVSVLGAICSCYFIIYVSNLIGKNGVIKKYLNIMGQNSLYLLCIHAIEMRVFPWSMVLQFLEKIELERAFYFVVIGVRMIGLYICAIIWIKLRPIIKKLHFKNVHSDSIEHTT